MKQDIKYVMGLPTKMHKNKETRICNNTCEKCSKVSNNNYLIEFSNEDCKIFCCECLNTIMND